MDVAFQSLNGLWLICMPTMSPHNVFFFPDPHSLPYTKYMSHYTTIPHVPQCSAKIFYQELTVTVILWSEKDKEYEIVNFCIHLILDENLLDLAALEGIFSHV